MLLKSKNYLIFSLYLVVFVLLLSPYFSGIGNYWDWTVPYFSNQWWPSYLSQLASWQDTGLGAPMSYQSWFSFQGVIAALGGISHLKPEIFIVLLSSLLLTLASFGGYLMFSKKTNLVLSFFAALALSLNPAIYYKLLAGHLNYIFSYAVFLWLIYFLTQRYNPKKLNHAIVLGLFLAFVGVQIQFFVFAAIFCLLCFIFQKEKFNLWHILIAGAVGLLINLPWLSNFLLHANSIAASSGGAASIAFIGSTKTTILRILTMVFSNATVIQHVYDRWAFAYFGLLSLILFVTAILHFVKKRAMFDRLTLTYITSLAVFVFLGTGKFNDWPIPIVTTFYSMFREVGHFAPLIVAFMLIALLRIMEVNLRKKLFSWICTVYLFGFIAINGYYISQYLPKVDYESVRESFVPFEQLPEKNQESSRILSYPFWNQYGILGNPNLLKNGYLLNNSGWDSYLGFSSKEIISNYQPGGQSIESTLQYRLITTQDLTELEQRNVGYIYDFQEIYTSNWDRYTDPWTYFNDVSLIKNDPNIFEKLMAANPGRITKLSKDIYKLNNQLPRLYLGTTPDGSSENISGKNGPELYFKKINSTQYKIYIKGLQGKAELNFAESFHDDWKLYQGSSSLSGARDYESCPDPSKSIISATTECKATNKFALWDELKYLWERPMYDHSHQPSPDFGNRWEISKDSLTQLAQEGRAGSLKINQDGSIDFELTLYFWPQTFFYLALICSFVMIIGSICYLVYIKLVNRKQKYGETTNTRNC